MLKKLTFTTTRTGDDFNHGELEELVKDCLDILPKHRIDSILNWMDDRGYLFDHEFFNIDANIK